MLIDAQNMFSALTSGVPTGDSPTAIGSTASTNVIDLGVARDIGGAVTEQLQLLAEVITAFTSGGSATLQVQYQASVDNATWVTLGQSDAIAVAALIQGYRFLIGPPPSNNPGTLYRYLRLNYVIATAVMTAGAVVAGFMPAAQHSPTYARGYTA